MSGEISRAMSGADDQRAVEERFPHRRDIRLWLARHADDEPVTIHVGRTGYGTMTVDGLRAELGEVDRLRAELAETRDRRDYLQGQLDIIYDAEYSRNDALKRRIEKLTAELAEARRAGDSAEYQRDAQINLVMALREAGDALVDDVDDFLDPESLRSWKEQRAAIEAKANAWRSVRGDAPTQPPAEHHVEAFTHDTGCRDWGWQCFTCGEEDCGYDSLAKAERAGDQHRVVALVEVAAPAVARTDGQTPADDPENGPWADLIRELKARAVQVENGDLSGLPTTEYQHGLAAGYRGAAGRARVVLSQQPDDDEVPVDGLTAEQYRHIYTDLIHGLAVDLGLDPDKAGGGSVTAAVRRLVAGVSVPQKSTESPAGARCEHGVPVTRWCAGCTLTEQPPDGDR